MALEEQFAEAWLTSKHKVFGYKLLPFSCWHKFLLLASESPLMNAEATDEEISLPFLFAAAKICTLKYPESFSRGYPLLNRLRYWRYGTHAQGEKFQEFFVDHCHFPELWDVGSKEGNSSKSNNAPPDPLGTVCQIMRMGLSEKEAWDMPIGKAYWYSTVQAQLEGADVDFLTDKERQIQKDLKDFEARVSAGEFKDMNPDDVNKELNPDGVGSNFFPPLPPLPEDQDG